MRRIFPPIATSLLFAVPLAVAAANPRPIVGTAVSSGGSFQISHTNASGTATILNGDQIETAGTGSKIMLKNGAEMELLPNSATSIFENHATLDEGTLRTHFSSGYAITSRSITVRPTDARTEAIVQTSSTSLTVSIPAGGADVISANGTKLVHMVPGKTLSFGAYDTGIDPNVNVARLTGVLDSENGHYLVRDRFSNTVSELQGNISPKLINHFVAVDGNVLTNQKPSVLQVDHLVQVSKISPSDATSAIPCTADGTGGVAQIIKLAGMLSKVRDHFLLADKSKGKTFELVGDVDDKEIGSDISARGFILPKREALLPAEQVVYTENRKLLLFASPCVGAIVGGTLITTGTLLFPKNDGSPATGITNPGQPISF